MAIAPAVSGEPITSEVAASTFELVWTTVRDQHFDTSYGGVDWIAVGEEFRANACAATTRESLRDILNLMLSRLGQSHFGVMPGSPSNDLISPAASSVPSSIGLTIRSIGGDMTVTCVDSDSPAARASIETGWILRTINGNPLSTPHLSDVPAHLHTMVREREAAQALQARPGTTLRLEFTDRTEVNRYCEVTTEPDSVPRITFGTLPPIESDIEWRELSPDSWRAVAAPLAGESIHRVGYIRFSSWFPVIAQDLDRAVDELRSVDALVIDLRGNPGGVGFMAAGFAGHFFVEPTNLGDMTARSGTLHFLAQPRTVAAGGRAVNPFAGPIAILVDSQTASTSEVFAGGMVDVHRAEVFGGPSAGAALPAVLLTLQDGDILIYAIADFRVPSGKSLEGCGVHPTVIPSPTLLDYRSSSDPTLRQALEWIDKTLPSTTPNP